MRICFVCTGNICRSPTAEGILRHLLRQSGRAAAHVVESAGLIDYHVGERPDRRTLAVAERRGVKLESRARHFQRAHLDAYDLVLAMDASHLQALLRLAGNDTVRARCRLLRDYDPDSAGERDVPDPYYGEAASFEAVFDMCMRACQALLSELDRA